MKARAGTSLRARFKYLQPNGDFVDTTGSTARIYLRPTSGSGRIILAAEQSDVDGATLQLLQPGEWRFFLSGMITKTLPPSVSFELELTPDDNEDDVTTLDAGTILTSPQTGE